MTRTARPDGRLSDDSIEGGAAVWVVPPRVQTPAFNANYTPDLSLGLIIGMGLTGNITVNAPTWAGSSNLNWMLGTELLFKWNQSAGGGWVITYNATFHTGGGAALVTTNATATFDQFFFDTVGWRLTARITGQS